MHMILCGGVLGAQSASALMAMWRPEKCFSLRTIRIVEAYTIVFADLVGKKDLCGARVESGHAAAPGGEHREGPHVRSDVGPKRLEPVPGPLCLFCGAKRRLSRNNTATTSRQCARRCSGINMIVDFSSTRRCFLDDVDDRALTGALAGCRCCEVSILPLRVSAPHNKREPDSAFLDRRQISGLGIRGDRYAEMSGTYTLFQEPGRQLTLLSAEGVEQAVT